MSGNYKTVLSFGKGKHGPGFFKMNDEIKADLASVPNGVYVNLNSKTDEQTGETRYWLSYKMDSAGY